MCFRAHEIPALPLQPGTVGDSALPRVLQVLLLGSATMGGEQWAGRERTCSLIPLSPETHDELPAASVALIFILFPSLLPFALICPPSNVSMCVFLGYVYVLSRKFFVEL